MADQEIRQGLTVLPFVFFLFLAVSLLLKKQAAIVLISAASMLWVVATALKLVFQKRNLAKLRAAGPTQDSLAPTQIVGQGDNVIPARFSNLSSLTLPRRLKMRRVFRLLTFSLIFIALVFAGISYSLIVPPSKAPDDPRDGMKIVLIPVAISCAIGWGWWLERRRKKLLREGRVGFAVIMSSSAGQSSLLPGITYRFQSENGKEIEDFDHDWTDSFHKGMLVPIFYDSLTPENHVALCASFYDVASPKRRLD